MLLGHEFELQYPSVYGLQTTGFKEGSLHAVRHVFGRRLLFRPIHPPVLRLFPTRRSQ